MTQKEAVVSAILGVLAERNVEYTLGGEVVVSDILTSEDKSEVRACLFTQFKAEEIDLKAESKAKYMGDDKELKKYVSGLLNNWVRKLPDFNAGSAYKAKNPGSRAGNSDDQIKALRALLTQTTDAGEIEQINTAIDKRQAEIAVEKAKSVVINVDALPDHLKALVKS